MSTRKTAVVVAVVWSVLVLVVLTCCWHSVLLPPLPSPAASTARGFYGRLGTSPRRQRLRRELRLLSSWRCLVCLMMVSLHSGRPVLPLPRLYQLKLYRQTRGAFCAHNSGNRFFEGQVETRGVSRGFVCDGLIYVWSQRVEVSTTELRRQEGSSMELGLEVEQ